MKKYYLPVVIVIVVVGGLLAVFWFFPEIFPFSQDKNINANSPVAANNLNQAANNANQATVNLNISLKKGAIEINKSVIYKEVEFQILTADKLDTFENQTATEGKTLVILYLQRITSRNIAEMFSWLRNDLKMTNDQSQEYALKSLNLAGESAPDYAASYFIFEAGSQDKGFALNFGSGADLKSLDLGF